MDKDVIETEFIVVRNCQEQQIAQTLKKEHNAVNQAYKESADRRKFATSSSHLKDMD